MMRFKLTEAEQTIIDSIHQVELGALWIIQAIANSELAAGRLTPESLWDTEYHDQVLADYFSRYQEFIPELLAAEDLSTEILGRTIFFGNNQSLVTHEPLPPSHQKFSTFFRAYFYELASLVLETQEKLPKAQVIMIAGHQGSGKGVVSEILQRKGFISLPMSSIVKELTATWALRSTQTLDKIITGQIFKEYFGKGILVNLGLQYLVSENQNRIVIDGPRVIEEAQALLRAGGTLIGVTTNPNPALDAQIRRQRIVARAEKEPNRVGDIANFDSREAIEADKINDILRLIPAARVLVNDQPDISRLETQLDKLLTSSSV